VNDTIVTVVGNVVDSPRKVRFGEGAVTNFRLASTSRRYDAAGQQWVDAGTFWVDVEAWNGLSSNVSASISKGDPVIVHGALTTHSWESDTGPRSKPRIKAFSVGPDLARCTAEPKRTRSARTTESADDTGAEMPSSSQAEGFSEHDRPVSGRDYVTGGATLVEENPDLDPEPALA
jgi:single-strand DNA-binding protein